MTFPRVHWYHFVSMLLLVPRLSSAIQLTWSGGGSDLTFLSATRCTLVVQAGSAEVRLPGEWRLMWIADSSGVNLVAADSLAACQTDTAQASTIDPPSTVADSAAHQFTAHFCSGGSAQASVAYFILDQPGGSHGRLKVVALDPADPDSDRVIESNEVTYNGGVEGDYAPVILHASGVHQSLQIQPPLAPGWLPRTR